MQAEAKSKFRELQDHAFIALLVGGFRRVTGFLPRWVMRPMAAFFCVPFIFLTFGNYRAVMANLRTVFPEKGLPSLAALAYRMYLKYSYYLIDLFFISHGRDRIRKFKITYIGDEILFEAMKSGKGIIVLTLHMGNWEIGGIALAQRGYRPPVIAYYPDSLGTIEEQRNRLRGLSDTEHIELRPGEFSAIKFLRVLQEGGVIAIQGDRLQHDSGVGMEMFGHKARFPKGPVMLASAADAIILPTFMVMEGYNKYNIYVENPVTIKVYSTRDETIRQNLAGIITVFEKYIKKYPDQWYTFMPFWDKDKEKIAL